MDTLNRFDLNLLIVLNVLLTERSVTRAADLLCVTQPAMSGSLHRLREQFQDPLLIRVGREMELTPTGAALIAPVREALLKSKLALETRAQFIPAEAKRNFCVAMSDFCVNLYLPHVLRITSSVAPGIRIVLEPVMGQSFDRLDNGHLDMIVTHNDWQLFGDHMARDNLMSQFLFEDDFVCVTAVDHPAGNALSVEDYERFPHAITHVGSNTRTLEEAALLQLGIHIDAQILVPIFSGLLYQLPGTSLIATVPRRLATSMMRHLPIQILEPPLNLPTLSETLIWHPRSDTDPGHRWMRDAMIKAATSMH